MVCGPPISRDWEARDYPRKSPPLAGISAIIGGDFSNHRTGLAGAGGIEPPNGGIKISLIIQQFQGAFGKNGENTLQQSQGVGSRFQMKNSPPRRISLGQYLRLDEKVKSFFASWSEEKLIADGAYFGAYYAAVVRDFDFSFTSRCALSVSDFNAKRGFLVRSEGGRICCDFNGLLRS